jgi:uncharacterized protein (DUF1015 family)
MTVKPFRALRPDIQYAERLNVPPYDVVTSDEVKKRVRDNPYSFFHVTRAEADISGLSSEYAPEVYQRAGENLKKFLKEKILLREDSPSFYLIAQTWKGRTQTGIYSLVSCGEYENNKIKKHEFTRKDKEEDRTNHITAVQADTGPVFLAFQDNHDFMPLVRDIISGSPLYHLTDENDVEISLWKIGSQTEISGIERYFLNIPAFYIADGHHRAASAVNVWKKENKPGNDSGTSYFMAVLFPSSQLEILPYHRAVLDLNNLSEDEFLQKCGLNFLVKEASGLSPEKKGEIGMYIRNKFFILVPKEGSFNKNDPLDSLDVSILQKNLLAPVLGIEDPRTSKRVQFVGGIKGPKELIRLVDEKTAAVSFCLYPVSMNELISITDSHQVMPPKSTWFEPKLRDGLITYYFGK